MSTWWRYPRRRFTYDAVPFEVRVWARTDGLKSQLRKNGAVVAEDQTPIFGPEAVRNHRLASVLPDGRAVDPEKYRQQAVELDGGVREAWRKGAASAGTDWSALRRNKVPMAVDVATPALLHRRQDDRPDDGGAGRRRDRQQGRHLGRPGDVRMICRNPSPHEVVLS